MLSLSYSTFLIDTCRRARLLGLACLAVAPWCLAAPPADSVERQVAQAARQFLIDQATREGLSKPAVEAAVVNTARIAAPCRQPVVTPIDTRHPSRMRFAAACDGTGEWRQEFVVRAEVSAEVVVTTAAVPAGRALAQTELALERRNVTAVPDAQSDPDAVAGLSSQRPLRAGQIVRKRALAAPVLVKRGEGVQIVVRGGVVEVSAAGEALETGRLDEIIRVRNAGTGKTIRARVTDKSTVEPAGVFIRPHSPD